MGAGVGTYGVGIGGSKNAKILRPASPPGIARQQEIGVALYSSIWSACDGILRSFGLRGTEDDDLGVGDAVTVTFVELNILGPPKAKNSDPSASAPSTIATIILFRSFGDLPSKGFFTIYYCSCG